MQVRLNSTLRGRVGRRAFHLDLPHGATVRQALDLAAAEAPDLPSILLDADGNLQSNIVIFCNGRNIAFFDGLQTRLQPSDTVDIFPKTGAQRAFAAS